MSRGDGLRRVTTDFQGAIEYDKGEYVNAVEALAIIAELEERILLLEKEIKRLYAERNARQ